MLPSQSTLPAREGHRCPHQPAPRPAPQAQGSAQASPVSTPSPRPPAPSPPTAEKPQPREAGDSDEPKAAPRWTEVDAVSLCRFPCSGPCHRPGLSWWRVELTVSPSSRVELVGHHDYCPWSGNGCGPHRPMIVSPGSLPDALSSGVAGQRGWSCRQPPGHP